MAGARAARGCYYVGGGRLLPRRVRDRTAGVRSLTVDRKLDVRLGGFVVALCALLFANDLLPYAGGRDDSCQTMFSGLDWAGSWNNHVFLPQRPLFDSWEYLSSVRAEIDPVGPRDERIAYLHEWLDRPDRRFNVDAVRAVVFQICDAGHRVRMTYRDASGARREVANACEDEGLSSPSWWIPVRLYETDLPLPEKDR